MQQHRSTRQLIDRMRKHDGVTAYLSALTEVSYSFHMCSHKVVSTDMDDEVHLHVTAPREAHHRETNTREMGRTIQN